MEAGDEADLFGKGLALFNAGHFFVSHEVWEAAWKRARGEDKLFYQGLIQAAAALLHVERGNLRGAESLLRKSKAKLETFPIAHMGLDLGQFREALEIFFADVRAGKASPWPRICRIEKRAD